MDGMEKIDHETLFGGVYKNKSVLVTGHTGFKGSWLALLLTKLGAKVTGYSLPPATSPSHFLLIEKKINIESVIGDIRDRQKLKETFNTCKPDLVFHLAAQPYVRKSYVDPVETYETNVIGTLNVLESIRETESVKAAVIITTDKCYENKEWFWSYREIDALGGRDPYSSSKACAEILTKSYRESFFPVKNFGKTHRTLIATCRAGNVIGGGDWGEDRLIPDIVRAVTSAEKILNLRYPDAIRPWQHVLEVSFGYLLLGQKLLEGKTEFADAWNFSIDGPDLKVIDIVNMFKTLWTEFDYKVTEDRKFPEHKLLKLDSSKARGMLGWKPVWTVHEAVKKTVEWYKKYYEDGEILSEANVDEYVAKLIERGGYHEKS